LFEGTVSTFFGNAIVFIVVPPKSSRAGFPGQRGLLA
jgi:hypothetical protein